MRQYGEEFAQIRFCVWDSLGFIVEQLQKALSPTDQFAAVDAAREAVRQLQSRLTRDERLCAHVAWCLPFSPYLSQPDWQDRWMELAKSPPATFAIEARRIIEGLDQLREVIHQLPDSD
jgi:hypothetical protein